MYIRVWILVMNKSCTENPLNAHTVEEKMKFPLRSVTIDIGMTPTAVRKSTKDKLKRNM